MFFFKDSVFDATTIVRPETMKPFVKVILVSTNQLKNNVVWVFVDLKWPH